MRIVDVRVNYLEVPLKEPGLRRITAPDVIHKTWPCTLVRVFTDNGLVGFGAQSTQFGSWSLRWGEYVLNLIKPQLINSIVEPFYVGKFSREIVSQPPSFISPRPTCVDTALWDLIGKAAKLPIYRLLGAVRDKVKAYASSFAQYPRFTPKDWVDYAAKCVEEGFKAIKLKQADPVIERDIENVKAVRDAVGSDIDIMVDAISAWKPFPPYTLQKAIKLARGYEKYDVAWLEEPLDHLNNLDLSAQLCAAVDIPIAGGGQIFGAHHFKTILEKGALDIVQADVENVGGLLEARKVSILAEMYGRVHVPHVFGPSSLPINLQLAGVTNTPYLEYAFFPPAVTIDVFDAILKEPITIDKEGYIHIPSKPGLGVELDGEAIEKYTVTPDKMRGTVFRM